MDILSIAEENFIIAFGLVLGIGILQGAVLSRGIRKRFPSLKRHTRIVSLSLFTLFAVNAAANIIKFAVPEKLSLSNLTIPTTPEEGVDLLLAISGLNAGLGTTMALIVSIAVILFLRFADISSISKYFIFSLSVITVMVVILTRITDYAPNVFQVIVYAIYQFGITIGLFVIMRRKGENLPEIN